MKKILSFIIIVLLCLTAYSGTMDNYLNAQHRINSSKNYFGGIDQNEMTLKAIYLTGTVSAPANATNYIGTAMDMVCTNIVTVDKIFVPMNLRITKSGQTADSLAQLFLMSKCLYLTNLAATNTNYTTVATNHVTNYMGQYMIPEGNALYEFGYPVIYSNYFIEYSQILVRIENTSSLTCSFSVQMTGFEMDE